MNVSTSPSSSKYLYSVWKVDIISFGITGTDVVTFTVVGTFTEKVPVEFVIVCCSITVSSDTTFLK